MTPEGKVTAAINRHLRKLKAAGEPVWWVKLHGGPMQRAGIPDLLVIYKGRTFFVEVKAPGQKPTRLQCHTHAQMVLSGATVMVVTSLEMFRCFMEALAIGV
jgi:hypothetical protein